MLDCHNIMFLNTPPQFTATEFGFDLPAEEIGIDLGDSATWEIWAQNEREYQRPSPLNRFIQELLSDDWPGLEDPKYSNLNIFALFIVVSAFQPMIYGLRSSLCNMSDATSQLERALSRWMSLWERLKLRLTQEEIYRAGITYHAPDLCVFARLVLQKPLSETGEVAQDSMAQIHKLLKQP
ncbi:hypothetical protein N7490_012024 [Penicillium lividum]|nr:hypothetical protein N7490_012024 [Penicillium lividum]